MFGFFVNGSFFSFWQNVPGDLFIVNTMKKLRWNPGQVVLRYYETLYDVPQFSRFEANGDVTILRQVSTPSEVEGEEPIITYEEIETIQSILYYDHGNIILPC